MTLITKNKGYLMAPSKHMNIALTHWQSMDMDRLRSLHKFKSTSMMLALQRTLLVSLIQIVSLTQSSPHGVSKLMIKQEDRTNLYLYLELLHRQNHTITMNMKDEKGQKQNVDFRITAQLVDRSPSNEMMATFTAKWPERKNWKVTYAHELQFIADIHHRRHGTFSPSFLTGKNPENPYELASYWDASRAVNWSKMSSCMAIPTKINQMTFSIPT